MTDSFDTTSNFPFPSPPAAPAPGPSLLDDNESKYLESFFDGVSSDQFNYDFLNNAADGAEYGLANWDELPPTFMGTTSSFGPQPQIGSHGIPSMNFGEMNPQMNPAPIPQTTTSADILAAATVLNNGSNGRAQGLGDGTFRGQNLPVLQTNGQGRTSSMSQSTISRPQPPYQSRLTGEDFSMRDNFYTDMVFGSQSQNARHRGLQNQKFDIRWGSDAGFSSPQGFVPPANQDHIVHTERAHIQAIEAAFAIKEVPSSAENTRPPSPDPRNNRSRQRNLSISQDVEEDELDYERPRKRRKSKYTEEADEDEESPASTTPRQGLKRRKPVKKSANESPVTESEQSHKRRKSAAAAAAKASRENLTEEQKRENHIKSEQKRRTLIREGFEDLGELVPGLRGGGFSKSAVLIMAADWLEDLIRGNEELRNRLDQMEPR